jgi:hypothetical protein
MTRCTVSGNEPTNPADAPTPTDATFGDGQKADHWVMCPGEIIKAGFKRPVRKSYVHVGPPGPDAAGKGCGTVTNMPTPIAETFAANPAYYGSTFCCGCRKYLPVGQDGEFVWDGTTDRVGT